jgi:hypothetical protein
MNTAVLRRYSVIFLSIGLAITHERRSNNMVMQCIIKHSITNCIVQEGVYRRLLQGQHVKHTKTSSDRTNMKRLVICAKT